MPSPFFEFASPRRGNTGCVTSDALTTPAMIRCKGKFPPAVVEVDLLYVLQACTQKADIEVIAAVFYAVENFRSKLGVVDAALNIALKGSPILHEWSGKGGLYRKISAQSSIRNSLAHYMVIHLGVIKKPPAIYFTPVLTKAK
jgi:hypothetical protein